MSTLTTASVVNPTTRRGAASSSGGGGAGLDSDSDSTSTELCDEPDRMSDLDSEELTSNSDNCQIITDSDADLSAAVVVAAATSQNEQQRNR